MNEELKRILEHTRKIERLSKKIRESDISNLGLAIGIEREASKIKRDLAVLMSNKDGIS